jgi:hypothetical protein
MRQFVLQHKVLVELNWVGSLAGRGQGYVGGLEAASGCKRPSTAYKNRNVPRNNLLLSSLEPCRLYFIAIW